MTQFIVAVLILLLFAFLTISASNILTNRRSAIIKNEALQTVNSTQGKHLIVLICPIGSILAYTTYVNFHIVGCCTTLNYISVLLHVMTVQGPLHFKCIVVLSHNQCPHQSASTTLQSTWATVTMPHQVYSLRLTLVSTGSI